MTESLRFETLAELLERAVVHHGDKPAYGFVTPVPGGGTTWAWITYNELARRVAACRAALAELGVGRGDRVAIIAENRLEWVIAAHATFNAETDILVRLRRDCRSEPELAQTAGRIDAKVCFVGICHWRAEL